MRPLATLGTLMRASDDVTCDAGGRNRRQRVQATTVVASVLLAAVLLAACSSGPSSNPSGLATPSNSVVPTPNYPNSCAPVGEDSSTTCIRLTLAAIDNARAGEGLGPMLLPADFAQLTVPEQLFVVLNRERVDRGLAPFTGLSTVLDATAQKGADTANLPPRPGRAYAAEGAEWIGAVDNGLDADYQWLYDDGPDSGVPNCSSTRSSGCWADRQIVLQRFGSGALVMGAAYDANGDTSPGDQGGSSLAATLAVAARPDPGRFVYTWNTALATTRTGTLRPLRSIPASESNSGVPDPTHNVQPDPDYTRICSGNGVDNSNTCITAALDAINHAHAIEGVRPMVLPAGFPRLSIPDQLFVVVNLERADRGLPTFNGLTAGLDANAQRGANDANDPPDPGPGYVLDDAEWAGGSSNGLDAVYGWMYDDGYNSGNLDCLHRGDAGCWGHRKGILDDFGSGPNLVMGAAIDTTGDHHSGDNGGTSMAVTLAVAGAPAHSLLYTWGQVLAALPPSSGVPNASG
ncbi:MAG TPA: hypothetical protein VK773_00180 [Acidimicrobiales bacterium]|jgi:hypothetical protein|nr:hypothetical protein [Acidimicrobiales bacterium]